MNAIGYAALLAMAALTTVAVTVAVEWRRLALRSQATSRLLHQALKRAEAEVGEANAGWADALDGWRKANDVIAFQQIIREGGLA